MKGFFVFSLIIGVGLALPYQKGNDFTAHLNVGEGNIDATATGNTSGGTILQSTVGNNGGNKFTNTNVANDRTRIGNSFLVSRNAQAGNVGAVLSANSASAHIGQTAIANNNNNVLNNQYNGGGNQYGSNFKTLTQVKVANANARIGKAQGSQAVTQNNAANSQANTFNNLQVPAPAGAGPSGSSSSPYSSYSSS